jgi:hypothetical protein
METRLEIYNSIPLWQNKTWSIEKISHNEIAITNGFNVIYGYLDKVSNSVRYDYLTAPKYIFKKAFVLAKKHLI